jgi:outer membrane protein OmpA-like peptidoglycan-associated protein
MRRSFLTIFFTLLGVFVGKEVYAQDFGGVSVSAVNMKHSGEDMLLEMKLAVSPDAAGSLQSVAVSPVMTLRGGEKVRFPSVLVNGRNRARIYKRHSKMRYSEIVNNPPFKVIDIKRKFTGEVVEYSAWMKVGFQSVGDLNLEFLVSAPAGERHSYTVPLVVASTTLADAKTPPRVTEEPVPAPAPVPAPVPVPAPATVTVPVMPVTTPAATPAATPVARPTTTPQIANIMTRSGSVNLDFDFRTASATLNPYVGHNARELARLEDVFAAIAAEPSSRIVSITIVGYSSLDGRYELNASLSYHRAEALSWYIRQRWNIPDGVVKVRGEGEDWEGFRAALEADGMFAQRAIFSIVDSGEAPDAKESRLRRLGGGARWRMMEREIFPWLRRVDYSINYLVD